MLRKQITRIAADAGAASVAVAFYDYASDAAWSLHGDRSFHAASTIKVAVLFALFEAFDDGTLPSDARLHVRNRFLSAVDGEPFRVGSDRDGNGDVHAAIGKLMPVRDLAYHMITTSSNLATNLLVGLLTPDAVADALKRHQITGVKLLRGVEDEKAWEAGLNNTVTANGLVTLFRTIHDGAPSDEAADGMRAILFEQRFRSGIPGGLPDDVRDEANVAHKTGEISTVAHDAGLVFLPDRAPYALAILTEWDPEAGASADDKRAAVAAVSGAVYEHLAEAADA